MLGGILLSKNTFANNGIKEYCAIADSPDIDLIYPVSDPLDPTNFSSGLIDFQLPLNVTNSVQYDPLTNQYIFKSTDAHSHIGTSSRSTSFSSLALTLLDFVGDCVGISCSRPFTPT